MSCEWKSESIDKIAPALLAAQKQLQPVVKDHKNPAFPRSMYADLSSVLDVIGDALHPNGLFITQLPMPFRSENGAVSVVVRTVIMHESGQWIASDLPMCADMANPQKIGSCITYARRYGAAAIVGLQQEDDDGETANGRGKGYDYDKNPVPNGNGGGNRSGNGNGSAPSRTFGAPTKGVHLFAWAKDQQQQFGADVVKWLDQWGVKNNLPSSFKEWPDEAVKDGHAWAVGRLNKLAAEKVGAGEAAE